MNHPPQRLRSMPEKPLTSIDYIAALERCTTVESVREFGASAPAWVRGDDRFTRAVAKRLSVIVANK